MHEARMRFHGDLNHVRKLLPKVCGCGRPSRHGGLCGKCHYRKLSADPEFMRKKRERCKLNQRTPEFVAWRRKYDRQRWRRKRHLAYRKSERGRLVRRHIDNRRRSQTRITDFDSSFLWELKTATAYCVLCFVLLFQERRHLDHVVPLAVGGCHVKKNVRYICATCNFRRPKDGRDGTVVGAVADQELCFRISAIVNSTRWMVSARMPPPRNEEGAV